MIDQHNSLAEKFIKKWFWLYLFSFIIAPIGYFVKIIISHDLEVNEIWIIYWVMSLMVLLSSFNDLWMSESLNKFLPEFITKKEYSKAKSIILYALLMQSITWLIIFLIFFFWADFIWNNYFKDSLSVWVIKNFAFFFLAINILQVFTMFFAATQNTFLQKWVEAIRMFLVLIITTLLFFNDLWNINTYSFSWVIPVYLSVLIALFIFYKKFYKKYFIWEKIILEKDFFLKIFKYALLVFLASQAGTILSQMDMQMIIYILWNTDAWYYTNYLSIIWIPFMIVWPIIWMLFPIFSELYAKKENNKIILIKEVFQKTFVSFTIVFSILFFVFSNLIATILFWEKFEWSWEILKYSVLFISFNFLLQLNFNILASIWRVKERLKIILIAIWFNFIMNLILINYLWAWWAALATWLWWILIWFLSELKLKEYKVKIDFKYYMKNILIFIIIWIIFKIIFLGKLEELNNRFYEFLALLFISLIYFSIYIWVNINDFKYFLNEIKKVKNKN